MSFLSDYDPAELVKRKVESDELDYKSAMSWQSMSRQEKAKIVRHLTAFANTRGGFLVIGVSEDNSGVPSVYTGVSMEQAGSFDPTPVGDFVNSHIEPAIDFSIERPTVDGKNYVIFVVRPFKTLPHVCSRGVEGELQEGLFYIRTSEASSRPARRAFELQELLRRCMRNEREQLGRILRGILYESRYTPDAEPSRMHDIAIDAERYFRRRRHPAVKGSGMLVKFFIIPDVTSENIPEEREKLSAIFAESLLPCKEVVFLSADDVVSGKTAPDSLRFLSDEKPLMWQFSDCGLFCFFRWFPENISLDTLAQLCAECTCFAGSLGEKLGLCEELVTLKLVLSPLKNGYINKKYSSSEKEISAEIKRSIADLNSGREQHAARLLRRIGERFKLPDSTLDRCKKNICKISGQQ